MDWHKFKITGGPHTKNTVVLRDGEPIKGVVGASVHFDLNDVVRLDLKSYVETAEVEVEGVVRTRCHLIGIVKDEAGDYTREAIAVGMSPEGRDPDLVAALEDLLQKVKEAG